MLHAFLISASSTCPGWAVIFLQELDFIQHPLDTLSFVEGHSVYKHWPGPGSRTLGIVVHREIRSIVANVIWRGRAGGIHLCSPFPCELSSVRFASQASASASPLSSTIHDCNVVAVGFHGAHGDVLGSSLFDVSSTLKFWKRWRGATASVVVLGDTNVDLLPSLACDPFLGAGRSSHHSDRRSILNAWAEQRSFETCIPEQVYGVPGGRYSKYCLECPITRVPTGVQDGLPSILDFAPATPKTIYSCKAYWNVHESDHALLRLTVVCRVHLQKRPKKRIWRPWHVRVSTRCAP